MDWQCDRGLQARMGLTMVLLVALYLVFLGVLTLYVQSLLVIVVVMGAFMLAQVLFSDRLALRSMGAREVDPEEYPDLHRAVDRLAQQADLPKPTVAVAETSVPNAFATGRSTKTATVAVTTGLMDALTQEELDGVIAHELAHIKNRDVLVMTIASFLSTIAFVIVRWGWLFGGRNRRGGGIVVAIGISLVVWVVSFVLVRTLSRYREYAADRGGARITGRPAALATALMKIDGQMDRVPDEDLRDQAEMNAFFVIPVTRGFIGRIARTHPPTEKRIERLQAMERDLEGR